MIETAYNNYNNPRRKRKILIVLVVMALVLVAMGIIAVQIISLSYNIQSKVDTGAGATNASSASFIQRFISGFLPVGNYSSSSYSGRFGILEEDAVIYVNVSLCTDLNTANTIYTLNISVSSAGTCFNITANNVTLDCQGFIINYSKSTTGYAVKNFGYNVSTVENCNILQGRNNAANSYALNFQKGANSTFITNNISVYGSASSSAKNYGIYLTNYSGTVITENIINTTGRDDYGVYLFYTSNSTNITNNKITTTAIYSHGVYAYRASLNILNSNNITIRGNSAHALYLYQSDNNNASLNNLSVYGSSSSSAYLSGLNDGSDNNKLSNNSVYCYGASGAGISIINYAKNNLVESNKIYTNATGTSGIYLYTGINQTIINSNEIVSVGSTSRGIQINRFSNYNNVTNNNITSSGVGNIGLYILSSGGTQNKELFIINNTVKSTSTALYMTYTNSSRVYNNIFNSSIVGIVSTTSNAGYVNTHNTTLTDLTPNLNIIGGIYLGGNHWVNSLKTGFSQTCKDYNNDGICDTNYTINAYNKDFLALTTDDAVNPGVSIFSPENDSYVNGRVELKANASDNFAVSNVQFQYSNSSVAWTNLASCNATTLTSGYYRCYWTTTTFSNSSLGYNIRAVAYDVQGNTGVDYKHYTIDRTKPIIQEMSVIYPASQSSIRNGQNASLRATVTDSPTVAAGIDYVQANISSLNLLQWTNMSFILGSKAPTKNSTWNLNVSISSTTGTKYPGIRVIDAAKPLSNNMTGSVWNVEVDNDVPTYDSLASSSGDYNNTKAIFVVNAHDNFDLDHYIFSSNWNGVWSNDSSVLISGKDYYIEHKKVVYTGTFSYKFYIYDDAGNMAETSEGSIEVLENAPTPSVYLVSPLDLTVTNNNAITFQYYYQPVPVDNCSLILDGIENETTVSPAVNITLSFSSKTLADSNEHSWYVSCLKLEEEGDAYVTNEYSSEIYSLDVDTLPPLITIVSPLNITYNNASITFNVSINDDISWCGYDLNNEGNVTMSSENLTSFSYITSLIPKNYSVIFSCNDTANNYNSSVLSFDLKFSPVSINLTSPLNNAEIVRGGTTSNEDDLLLVDNYMNITAKVYDEDTPSGMDGATCYFYFNVTYLGENYTDSNGDCVLSFDKSSYNPSNYNLSVNYTYLINDISRVKNESVVNISLVRYLIPNVQGNKGTVNQYVWNQTAILYFNITKTNATATVFYDPVNITANATDSSGKPYPEEVYLSGYRVYKNAVGQYQTNILLNQTLLKADGYTSDLRWAIYISDDNWSNHIGSARHLDVGVTDGPICGNNIIELPETCDDGNTVAGDGCSSTCSTEGGGGDGGGGDICTNKCSPSGSTEVSCVDDSRLGTRICQGELDGCLGWSGLSYTLCGEGKKCINAECVVSCEENWQCSEWSLCENGTQTRTCNDVNNCGTALTKPETESNCLSRECHNGCCPSWNCTDFGECQAKYNINEILSGTEIKEGTSKKTCEDLADCVSNMTLWQGCNLTIPIEAKKVVWCEEDYVEIYEKTTQKLVSRVRETEITAFSKLIRVDISFITSQFEGYCSYCYDGIKNYDETSTDCGGPNCPVCIQKVWFFDWLFWLILLLWTLFILFLIWLYKEEEEEKKKRKPTLKERAKNLFRILKPKTPVEERVVEKKIGREAEGIWKSIKNVVLWPFRVRISLRKPKPEIRIRKLEEIKPIRERTEREKVIADMKKDLREWKEKGYAGVAELDSKIKKLEERKDSVIRRVVRRYKESRQERAREKEIQKRREDIERRQKEVERRQKEISKRYGVKEIMMPKLHLYERLRRKVKEVRLGFGYMIKKRAIRKEYDKRVSEKESKIERREVEKEREIRFKEHKREIEKRVKERRKEEKIVKKKEKKIIKQRRKEKKKKIRRIKREIRKRKFINLMRKLKLWRKEGYYGTAELETELKKLRQERE